MRFLRKLDGLKVMTFVTMTASLACVGFVWYLWDKFDIKSQALARNGSDAAEYMRISTMVLGSWILPALVVISVLALTTFVLSMRRRQPATS